MIITVVYLQSSKASITVTEQQLATQDSTVCYNRTKRTSSIDPAVETKHKPQNTATRKQHIPR